jgi:PIN domain nuclease of toxin-antitoxin system
VKLLLDTHAMLWLASEPSKLSECAIVACQSEENQLTVSIASFWELSIKMSLDKINLQDNALAMLRQWCDDMDVMILPITIDDCERLKSMPFHHRDPFDRLIIAQSQHNHAHIISADQYFSAYDCNVIW